MGRKVADDQAFLDALIDMRSIVSGADAETLGTIVDRYDIARRQTKHLKRRARGGRRLRSAAALAELADMSAAQVLIEHLSDDEQEVRIQCARGLGRLRWTPAIRTDPAALRGGDAMGSLPFRRHARQLRRVRNLAASRLRAQPPPPPGHRGPQLRCGRWVPSGIPSQPSPCS